MCYVIVYDKKKVSNLIFFHLFYFYLVYFNFFFINYQGKQIKMLKSKIYQVEKSILPTERRACFDSEKPRERKPSTAITS